MGYQLELEKNEHVAFSVTASLSQNTEFIKGMIHITNRHFYFKPNFKSVQQPELAIYLEDIASIQRAKVMGIFPNALNVTVAEHTYTFIIGTPFTRKWKKTKQHLETLIAQRDS